jgi:hypothetical protein
MEVCAASGCASRPADINIANAEGDNADGFMAS